MSDPLANTTGRGARALIAEIEGKRGWPRHESNGWHLDTVGPASGHEDEQCAWVRAMCKPLHGPKGWTMTDELARFAAWLAEAGLHLERLYLAQRVYRVVPGVVAVTEIDDETVRVPLAGPPKTGGGG